jgi:hypothetical protein
MCFDLIGRDEPGALCAELVKRFEVDIALLKIR